MSKLREITEKSGLVEKQIQNVRKNLVFTKDNCVHRLDEYKYETHELTLKLKQSNCLVLRLVSQCLCLSLFACSSIPPQGHHHNLDIGM